MPKYHIITYGCQMNVHESEKIAGILEKHGYMISDDRYDSDIIIFNTCCIRENAEHRAYGNIGRLKQYKKSHPEVIVGVVGCMTQQENTAAKLKEKFPFIDLILGTHNLSDLDVFLHDAKAKAGLRYQNTEDKNAELDECIPTARNGFPHAFVNIIFGCNNFCTYCIVPYVRGREKSRDFDSIVREAESLLESGYKEITLLGQNVNSYGNDLGKTDEFARLLKTLAKLPYRYRLKFMTSHPKDLSDQVIDTIAEHENIAKSIHLPIQSGSDEILKRMNRRYTAADYLERIDKIRKAMPQAGISTDIMVGFPGESEEHFLETMNVVERARFANAFTFIYSRRGGTVADKMPDQVDEAVKSERIGRLIKLQNSISIAGAMEYLGKTYEILIDNMSEKPGCTSGRTDSGRLVYIPKVVNMAGKFVNVEITKTGVANLYGKLVD